MTDLLNPSDIEHAANLISQADALIVAAGAGIGVDSGLPDFRGTEGFWKAYPALGREQVDFHRIACPEAFRTQPRRAWGFYGHRLNLYRETQPHAGFQILKRWGERMLQGSAVFTSNVDGQFQQAGFDQDAIHECHGSIHHLQCLAPCCEAIWSADDFLPEVDVQQCLLLNAVPTCPHCGGLARPNIMMFNDWDWLANRQDAQNRRIANWLLDVSRPVVVEIGAGTAIPSVRHFSQQVIHKYGGRLVRINPREFTVPSRLDVGLASGSLNALVEIERVIHTATDGARMPTNIVRPSACVAILPARDVGSVVEALPLEAGV
jgi:NAD-dependent SIR2 family protein deacetylase